MLNEVSETYKNEVAVIGINMYDKDPIKLQKFIDHNKVNYNIFLTTENPLQIKAFPTLFILDENFNIIASYSGFGEYEKKEIIELIENHKK